MMYVYIYIYIYIHTSYTSLSIYKYIYTYIHIMHIMIIAVASRSPHPTKLLSSSSAVRLRSLWFKHILNLRGGMPRSIGHFPDIYTQTLSVCGFLACGLTVLSSSSAARLRSLWFLRLCDYSSEDARASLPRGFQLRRYSMVQIFCHPISSFHDLHIALNRFIANIYIT